MIEIRPAVPADAVSLARLRWEFRANRPNQQTVESEEAFVRRCADWMRRELQAGGVWRAWVADETTDDGRRDDGRRDDGRRTTSPGIVGQVWLQLFTKLPNPAEERERLAYLSNLYVQPAVRGGVGARLLEAALALAEREDVDRVVLWPSARSVSLYERHGFRRIGDVMELVCPPPRKP